MTLAETRTPKHKPSERLHAVQILRGAAAMMVVIAHIIEHPQAQAPVWTYRTGRFGVELFFVISGIIIAQVAGSSRFDPGRFALHRFFRVAPLYWVTTLAVAACALWFPSLFKTTVFDVGTTIKALLFIPAADPTNANDWRPIYKLGWTLNYEVFFYLAIVLLFWCRTEWQRAVGLTAMFGALILIGLLPEDHKTLFSYYANLNVLPFVLGVWMTYGRRRGLFDHLPWPLIGVVGIAAVGACAAFYGAAFDDLGDVGPHLLMTLASVLIMLFGLTLEARVDWRPYALLETIGDNSYSLYLIHMFIVGAAAAVLKHAGLHGVLFWTPMAGVFFLCLIAANLSYRYLEMPINRFGRTLTLPRARAADAPAE